MMETSLRTQPQRTACRVHRDVAAAHDGDLLRMEYGRARVLFIRLHEVDARQKLVRGKDALQVLAGDIHEPRQSSRRLPTNTRLEPALQKFSPLEEDAPR